jgi:hypothetical protein
MPSRSAIALTKRWMVVLLTIAAWLFLSNHCVLALDGSVRSDSKPGGCPMHSTPVKDKPAAKTPCCKEVRAIIAKCVLVREVAPRLLGSQDYPPEIFLAPLHVVVTIEGLDTGPPGSLSFAESVLQESMLAHAPPVS